MEYIEYYAENNMFRLRRLADGIIRTQFPWLPQMYHDDVYALASDVLMMCANQFDSTKGAQFESFLTGCVMRKFKTRVTYMNRKRRNNGNADVSLEKFIEENGDILIKETSEGNLTEELSVKVQKYLDGLTNTQRQVATMIMEDYGFDDIKTRLHLSDRRFEAILKRLKAEEKTAVFDERNEEE